MFVQLTKDVLGRETGERIDMAEAEANELVKTGIAVPVTDDLITPAVSKALEGAFGKFTQAQGGIVSASLKQFADAQKKSLKNAVPAIFGPGNEGDPKKTFGDFLLGVARGDRAYLEKHYGSKFNAWQTKAALGEASGVPRFFLAKVAFPKLNSSCSIARVEIHQPSQRLSLQGESHDFRICVRMRRSMSNSTACLPRRRWKRR